MRRGGASVARGLVGKICDSCDEVIEVGTIKMMPGGYGWHSNDRGGGHTMMPNRVRNSLAAAAASTRPPRSRRSKTRRSTPHAGGRPKSFIAALVIAHAAQLFVQRRRWSDVLAELEQSGNGTYARNTLIRRVSEYSASQNSAAIPGSAAARRRRRRPSKTGRRIVASRR